MAHRSGVNLLVLLALSALLSGSLELGQVLAQNSADHRDCDECAMFCPRRGHAGAATRDAAQRLPQGSRCAISATCGHQHRNEISLHQAVPRIMAATSRLSELGSARELRISTARRPQFDAPTPPPPPPRNLG